MLLERVNFNENVLNRITFILNSDKLRDISENYFNGIEIVKTLYRNLKR